MKLMLIALAVFGLICTKVRAESGDDLRVHYYFLRASLTGKSPFADSLDQFRIHTERLRAAPIATNVTIYQKTQELIEANQRTNNSGQDSQVIRDLLTLSQTKYPDAANIVKGLSLYSTATGYLTSGPMRAPRAYEALGLKSQQDLDRFRDNVVFFTTKSNAGSLLPEEQKSLDLLFQYYTGVSTRLSKEQIMEDPLMLPVKEASLIETRLKARLGGDLGKLVRSTQLTQDLVIVLKKQTDDLSLKQAMQDAAAEVLQASSFTDIDKAIDRYRRLPCPARDETICADSKAKISMLAAEQKERIARNEFNSGIEQSIQLGIAIGKLTGSKDLTKSFQTLKAVNDAYQAVSTGITAFASSSTSMGQVAAVAGAATGVVGAAIVLSSLADKGPGFEKTMLESIQELKGMVVKLSAQIEAGFTDIALRTDRLEALLRSYSNLASKNDLVLQHEVSVLREEVRAGAQPLQFIRLSYIEKGFEQYRAISEKSIAIVLGLPKDPMTPLTVAARQDLTKLFAQFFSIVATVQRGEYKIAVSSDQAASTHFSTMNQLAAYPPSTFRSAFLMQNAINASQQAACASVNLIGVLTISDAATQLNDLLDKISHFQLADYFDSPQGNRPQFAALLENGKAFVEAQRKLTAECISRSLYQDFEKSQLRKLLALIEAQQGSFFDDIGRLNDMLITLLARYPLAGGFHRDRFSAGPLIRATRSFDPEKWDKESVLPFVLPIHGLGTQGFQISRKDYDALVTSYEVRLGHQLGADSQFYIESYWTPINNDGFLPPRHLNPLYVLITLASPRSQKMIHMWEGRIYPNWLTDASLYGERAHGKFVPVEHFKLSPDSMPRVYQMLNERGIGLLGLVDPRYGNRDPWPKWSDQLATISCAALDGFYRCPKLTGNTPYTRFVPAQFFSNPVCGLRNGKVWCAPPEGRSVSLDRDSQFFNPYRKEFSDSMRSYVKHVREVTKSALSRCLIGLVEGSAISCNVDGLINTYPDRTKEFQEVEQYNLLRMTLDASSPEVQRIMKATDVRQIRSLTVAAGPDEVIHRIDGFIKGLRDRLNALDGEPSRNDAELSSDLALVLENGHDRLSIRLEPFVHN